jgi:1-acyl-sn-glycerol-3-phosphate acyltransferase
MPFHANLIQSAILANAPVQPVSIRFEDAKTGEQSFAPSFIGDDTLLGSMWRTLASPGITAVVRFGDLQWAQGRDRRTWAHDLREEVNRLRGT